PSANRRAARIGPTVCELDGPIPILNNSKTLTAMPRLLGCCANAGLVGSCRAGGEWDHLATNWKSSCLLVRASSHSRLVKPIEAGFDLYVCDKELKDSAWGHARCHATRRRSCTASCPLPRASAPALHVQIRTDWPRL